MKICFSCKERFNSEGWKCPYCGSQPQKINDLFLFAPNIGNEEENFPVHCFQNLFELEAGNFWFRSRNQLIIWALNKFFPEAKNFLEIGCGTGFVLSGIAEANPHLSLSGSEIYSDGLAYASYRLKKCQLFQMDARRIPFENHFDVIGAFDVIEHIEEDEEVLSQIFNATRKGGGTIITVPQHPFLWSQYDEFGHHKRRYTRKELIEKVNKAGFSIFKITSFVSLLLPLLFISRMKMRKKNEYSSLNEFQLNPWLNKILEKMLGVERSLITLGASFRGGGSLLLVAKK